MPDRRLPLTSHLRELRTRVMNSAVALVVAFAVVYPFAGDIYGILTEPLLPSLPPEQRFMAFTGVVEPFFIYLKSAFIAAVILACPVIFYQGWSFVLPALKQQERRWLLPIVIASVLLFLSGVLFGYHFVFPVGFKYLLSFATPELKPILSMGLYFSLAVKLLLAFGIVFQLPLVMLVLARFGIVDAEMLIGFWKYALVLSVVAGAVLTPPDVFSQLLMGGPIMLLYGLGILVTKFFGKKKPAKEGEKAEDGSDIEPTGGKGDS